MKNRTSILVIVFVMLLSMPVWAGASGSGDQSQTQAKSQEQDQIQDQTMLQDQIQDQDQTRLQDQAQDQDQTRLQDQKQTSVDQTVRDQARLQLRERLRISEAAKIQQQERQSTQEQAKAGSFSDAKQHWASEQIASAYSWGFINGYQDGTFKPDGDISGSEGIIMVSRMINCTNNTEDTTANDTEIDLNAVPVWAREMIQEQTVSRIAAQSQLYGEEQLNRLQFAVMLAKALKLEPTLNTGENVIFLDQGNIPADDLGYINSLRILGIVEGSDGNFNPDKQVSRAEAASMLMRIVDSLE